MSKAIEIAIRKADELENLLLCLETENPYRDRIWHDRYLTLKRIVEEMRADFEDDTGKTLDKLT